MKVRDVMTRDIETIAADSNLLTAAKVLRRRNIGFLPVVSGDTVIGVLTDRDIVVRGIAEGRDPMDVHVREIMTRVPIWCYAEDVLTEAATQLEESHIRRLLVLDADHKLVGLLSIDDLAAHMSSERLLGTVVRNITSTL